MFKKELKARFEKIFVGMKVTFNAPSDHFEQDTIFISVANVDTRPMKQKISQRVVGFIQVFGQHEKLPFGFLSRKIETAKSSDTANLFFFRVDQENANSQARQINLSERQAQFVFLFSEQYDPNQGKITSIETEGTFT